MNWEPVIGSWVQETSSSRQGTILERSGDMRRVLWRTGGEKWITLSDLKPYTSTPTAEKIYEQAILDNNERLRWWKEGYAEGYDDGFSAGDRN